MLMDPPGALAERVFAIIDRRDADGFAALFAENGRFRFGNAAECHGRTAIASFVRGFFAMLDGLEHRIVDVCAAAPDRRYFHVTVRYRVGGALTDWLPALVTARVSEAGFVRYEIYSDPTPLNLLLYTE